MQTIHVRFERFSTVHFGHLFGASGVYVLWDGQSKARPTYIGEGHILRRLSDHWKRDDLTLAMPLDGYVAIFGDHGHRPSKQDGCAVEFMLLAVAGRTGRQPGVNKQPGMRKVVERLCDRGTLRIAVTGFDPLTPPWEARPLSRTKQIKVWWNTDDRLVAEADWRRRRVRLP